MSLKNKLGHFLAEAYAFIIGSHIQIDSRKEEVMFLKFFLYYTLAVLLSAETWDYRPIMVAPICLTLFMEEGEACCFFG